MATATGNTTTVELEETNATDLPSDNIVKNIGNCPNQNHSNDTNNSDCTEFNCIDNKNLHQQSVDSAIEEDHPRLEAPSDDHLSTLTNDSNQEENITDSQPACLHLQPITNCDQQSASPSTSSETGSRRSQTTEGDGSIGAESHPSSSDMELPPYDVQPGAGQDPAGLPEYNKYGGEFPPLYQVNQSNSSRNPETIPMLSTGLYDPPPRYDDSYQTIPDRQPTLLSDTDCQDDFMASTIYIDSPIDMLCPYCRKTVCTEIQYTPGVATYLTATTCCVIGGIICCFIPFCCRQLYDIKHICPHCRHTLKICRR